MNNLESSFSDDSDIDMQSKTQNNYDSESEFEVISQGEGPKPDLLIKGN